MTDRSDRKPLCPVDHDQCEYLSELVALRQQVSQLAELVHTDTLTGLNNFRFFIQALEQELERTRRTGYSTALVMMDLDHFKQVNDQWGHEVGNKALVLAAQLIRAGVRKMDIPCRYGGEEFAIILPSTDLRQSIQVAERIREMLENSPLFIQDAQEINLTASFGIELFRFGDSSDAKQLVRKADQLLYEAKASGRNQVCFGTQEQDASAAAVSEEEKDTLFSLFGGQQVDEE